MPQPVPAWALDEPDWAKESPVQAPESPQDAFDLPTPLPGGRELSPEERARTGMLYEEPGAVTGGTTSDPINQQPLLPASVIAAGYKASPLYWLGRAVSPEQTEGLSEGLSKTAASFTSPTNLGLLATAPLMPEGIVGKLGGTARAAYFEAQAARQFPEQWAEFQSTTD